MELLPCIILSFLFTVWAIVAASGVYKLIICGAEDSATPAKYSQYLQQHIANSTLRILQNAGHYVFREQPEAVNQAIGDWLEQQHL